MLQYNQPLKKIVLLSFLFCSVFVFSQSEKQKELEDRRQELRLEIQRINRLQFENKTKEKSQLNLIQSSKHKINVLDKFIKLTNQQANLLSRDINYNQRKISDLRDELKVLRADYAAMMVKSYKSKNQQSRIMFLLSAENFKQAYKRLQYMKQYTEHQKEQGETIKLKTADLQATNLELLKQQEAKKQLIVENREVQKTLEGERKQQEELMKAIKKNSSMYAAQIKQKQQEANRIDAEIDRIIKEAIAKSNKKNTRATATKSSSGFSLTPEEKVLAANFVANKGKLPWPVEKGYVTLGYGTQPHPIDNSLTIKSNGVRIATEKGAKVLAVFNGEVSAVLRMKNVNPIVMVRHGDYLTIYKNLSEVYVKEGDKVTTKQLIGEVFTNASSGETILSFSISKGTVTENPASWVFKM